ncbi:MAG: cyclic nucleotide-binding domain-containing protein [Polyangiaceae bacterium]|nr:cyclic nucleotide-binding domain-containing protein [Polyangiaceae bacterium]
MAALRTTPLFAGGRVDALAELASEVRERRFAPGISLFDEGDTSNSLLLCVSGTIACDRRAPPQRFRFGSGDAVGALDAIAGKPRWYSARAERDVVALELERDPLFELLEDRYDLALSFVRALSSELLRLRQSFCSLRSFGGSPWPEFERST